MRELELQKNNAIREAQTRQMEEEAAAMLQVSREQ